MVQGSALTLSPASFRHSAPKAVRMEQVRPKRSSSCGLLKGRFGGLPNKSGNIDIHVDIDAARWASNIDIDIDTNIDIDIHVSYEHCFW